MPLSDRFGRPLRSLRLSVTDRCNIRCAYCMPEADYVWLPREHLLTFEEMDRLVGVFTRLGADRVRLTGGEPLLRRELPALIARIAARPQVRDLAITTNGILLAGQASDLKAAGLHRVTVSLDTLDPVRFKALTRYDQHAAVLQGIDRAREVFGGLKIDTVVMRGVNDDEIGAMLAFGRARDAEVRFIEYMDVGGATRWRWEDVVGRDEMLARIAAEFGTPEPLVEASSAPADRFRLPDGTIFGVISSTTAPFCADCDRARLTADGLWLLCLYAGTGLDLRTPLRAGASDEQLAAMLAERWQAREDRGAEQRLLQVGRREALPADTLKENAHLEMHTRGG